MPMPALTFGTLGNIAPSLINAGLEDRSLREQAIREMAGNVTNSINSGFNRQAEHRNLQQRLAQELLQHRESIAAQKDLTGSQQALAEKLAILNNNTTMRGQDIGKELGIMGDATQRRGQDQSYGLGSSRLNLDAQQYQHANEMDNANFYQHYLDSNRDYDLKNRGMNLEEKINPFKIENLKSDTFKNLNYTPPGGFNSEDAFKYTSGMLGSKTFAPKGMTSDPKIAATQDNTNKLLANQMFDEALTTGFNSDGEISARNFVGAINSGAYEHWSTEQKRIVDLLQAGAVIKIGPDGRPRLVDKGFLTNDNLGGVGVPIPSNIPQSEIKKLQGQYTDEGSLMPLVRILTGG